MLTRHSFKTIFTEILPLRQPAKPPTHPFMQICILVYLALLPPTANPLTSTQSHEILSQLPNALIYATSSPPSFPIINGLLILAYLPGFPMVPQTDRAEGRALPSLAVVLQMAKGMALGMGMDRAGPSLVGIGEGQVMGLDGYMLVST